MIGHLHISIYANYSKDFTFNFGSKLAAFVCLAVKRGETFLNWKQSKICLWVARSDLARGETGDEITLSRIYTITQADTYDHLTIDLK